MLSIPVNEKANISALVVNIKAGESSDEQKRKTYGIKAEDEGVANWLGKWT